MKKPEKEKIIPLDEKLPAVKEPVIVVCKTFRCLGYRDAQGVWRDHANGQKLEDVIGWYNVGGDVRG